MATKQEAGKKGVQARHAKNREEESRIAKKAGDTRKSSDPEAFKKMGQRGGRSRSDSGRE